MPSSALLFPGQGSHAEGMDEPYRGSPLFERGLELLGYDPFEQLSEGTRYQQPALFLCSVAAGDAWREEGGDEAGARARRLDVTGAFHSSLMEPAADRLQAALEATPVAKPSIPVYSNGSAAPFVDVRRELAENLLRPVRWRETLLAMRTAR